ncbi:hypothetical protein Mesil_1576 [Allomeiothermus silvanus DSM 9946]|uniref:Uncharacterized protein n=1 Tax=Allomeiothermus silvanus (strain ATCC 700542 / DSM 9946 / NBRC 106475 / NCIMB 13440 / VI-R2) TaxID=526227 RepID=D7BFB3_ALLS1|nr:hypothetical protein [Allomeiothermus silvanus]ADH63466.1 hypothetical protein Mesil_1576 [Allomeiothermus silvanus DSM 9946]
MPSRFPHLPATLHRLLEAGPWQGTPTELYAALEPHRVEPWPANPASLSLWMKHHAGTHGVSVEAHHTGERRVLRLARAANGLDSATIPPDNAAFWSFPTWLALLEALPRLEGSGEVTLAFDLGSSRIAQTIPTGWLFQVVGRWAAQFPQAREVRVYPGAVEVSTVWPLG